MGDAPDEDVGDEGQQHGGGDGGRQADHQPQRQGKGIPAVRSQPFFPGDLVDAGSRYALCRRDGVFPFQSVHDLISLCLRAANNALINRIKANSTAPVAIRAWRCRSAA